MDSNDDRLANPLFFYIYTYQKLRSTVDRGKFVSNQTSGHSWEDRFSMGASLYFSICMAAETILSFLPPKPEGRIDHYSSMSLCRVIIEHSIMLHYLTEERLTSQEVDLRLNLLELHDASARYRLFKGLTLHEEAQNHKENMDRIKSNLRKNDIFRTFDQEKNQNCLAVRVCMFAVSVVQQIFLAILKTHTTEFIIIFLRILTEHPSAFIVLRFGA